MVVGKKKLMVVDWRDVKFATQFIAAGEIVSDVGEWWVKDDAITK